MNKKSFFISIFTVFVQYYDYHLFGFLAANIATHFFPADEIVTQLLNTYFIMAIAMVAKPLGAIVLGKIGDLHGRSNSFRISILGTAAASAILFAIPSYESIGLVSAFILLLCRMMICACVTSGSDGVRIYVYEHIDKSRQCLGIGVTALFTQAGSLTAISSAWFFTQDSLPDYSWRFAFLLGAAFGFALLIVIRISNFSDNQQVKSDPKFEEFRNLPLGLIIRSNWKLFLLCLILAGSIGSTNQFLIIFFGTYNFEILKTIDRSTMQLYILLAIIAYMAGSLIGGYMADRFGRFRVSMFATIAILVCSILLSIYLNKMVMNQWVFFALSFSMPFLTMPSAAIFQESIPIVIRYRLFALSHAIGSVFISAPTALLSTWIYQKTELAWLPICYFMVTILMIAMPLFYLNKIANKN